MDRRRGIASAAAVLLAACAAPPAPDPWTLWNVDALAQRGDPAVVPPGGTLRLLSSPFAPGTVRQQSTHTGLTVFAAFSEGQTAAYVTTEVWQNFDAVWVQPLYVPRGGPAGTRPVFGVGADTRFYSPFWQVFFYTPPEGKVFRSAAEVLDSGVALTPGPGKVCSITRDRTLLAAVAEGAAAPVRPFTGEPVGVPRNGAAWADGQEVWFVDLGANRFRWDYETLVVEETPLFAFTRSDGTPLDLPRVGGTGPWRAPACDGHGACSGLVDGKPQFGALWRVWNVALPDPSTGVDVYVPQSRPELRAYVQAQGFPAAAPAGDDARYTLRVALDGKTCFSGDLAGCRWLDSQNAIEDLLPDWRTAETERLVSCPLVLFDGKAIGP